MFRILLILTVGGVIGALTGGCVSPGEMDQSVVGRYQRHLIGSRAQKRQGQADMGLLQPVAVEGAPKLRVEQVVPRRTVITTTVTHRDTGEEKVSERGEIVRLVEIITTVKKAQATFSQRDPKTGQYKGLLKQAEPIIETTKELREYPPDRLLPKDPEPVTVEQHDRVGKDTWQPAVSESFKEMTHLSLEDAMRMALANNPEIRVVSYDPAISRQEMVKAASEFDYVVFGSLLYSKDDKEIASFFPGGMTHQRGYSAGIKQKTVTGAEWSLNWSMTRTWDNSTFNTLQPRFEPILAFEITQPLLRNAWPGVNLANLNLARVNYRVSSAAFRQKVEDVVTQTISAYWEYARARRDYVIQQQLLAETEETMRKVAARAAGGLASSLQEDQIRATVETRQSNLYAARKLLVDARDALAKRLAEAQLNVLTDYEVVPSTAMSDAHVTLVVKDQLLTALRHNPLLEQARLAIEFEAIGVTVAENQVLPKLDLIASTSVQGLGGNRSGAFDSFGSGDFVSYSVGLSLEYPLGNRGALAELERSRLSRYKAVAKMQGAADEVALAVRERIRQVDTAFDQIEALDRGIKAARAYRDKLEITVSERLGEAMTPERLQLLLGAQELVSNLERSRLKTVADYNTAMVDLARAKGTVLELNSVRVAIPAPQADAQSDE